jgi:hypothetical protein
MQAICFGIMSVSVSSNIVANQARLPALIHSRTAIQEGVDRAMIAFPVMARVLMERVLTDERLQQKDRLEMANDDLAETSDRSGHSRQTDRSR